MELWCDSMYEEEVLNGMFIEKTLETIHNAICSYWGLEKIVAVEDLVVLTALSTKV